MNEYVLFFRRDLKTMEAQPSEEQMQVFMNQWMEWIGGIAADGKLADGGNHLSDGGMLIRSENSVVDDIYVSNGESLTGYILINAENRNDALEIAKKCPLLNGRNTSVEVRETAAP